MNALTIHDVPMTPILAAELLALAPDVPPPTPVETAMSNDAVVAAIDAVIASHATLSDCLSELAFEYGEHPDAMSARMARCVVYAARLTGVTA